jgi:hypothetical protein
MASETALVDPGGSSLGDLRSATYMLERAQWKYVNDLARKWGKSASDVMREIVRIGAPLYDDDMTHLRARQEAREGATA